MPDKLYGGLHEQKFRSIAKKAVVEYWNGNKNLIKKHGEINHQNVYVVWQVKAIQNNKALLGVSAENDGMYFEFTYNGDERVAYLDVYKKQTKKVIEL